MSVYNDWQHVRLRSLLERKVRVKFRFPISLLEREVGIKLSLSISPFEGEIWVKLGLAITLRERC